MPSEGRLGLAIMAFCALLVESVVADWSAVYLYNALSSGMALVGPALIGFTAEAIGLSGALGIGVLLSLMIVALAARAGIAPRFSG